MCADMQATLERMDGMLVQLLRTSATRAAVAALKEDNTLMRNDISGLKADVAALREDNFMMRNDISDLKVDVAALKEDNTIMRNDINCLKADVADIRNEIDGVGKAVAAIDRRISRIVKEFTVQHQELVLRVSEFESSVIDMIDDGKKVEGL